MDTIKDINKCNFAHIFLRKPISILLVTPHIDNYIFPNHWHKFSHWQMHWKEGKSSAYAPSLNVSTDETSGSGLCGRLGNRCCLCEVPCVQTMNTAAGMLCHTLHTGREAHVYGSSSSNSADPLNLHKRRSVSNYSSPSLIINQPNHLICVCNLWSTYWALTFLLT
jgi:hypothetical protein